MTLFKHKSEIFWASSNNTAENNLSIVLNVEVFAHGKDGLYPRGVSVLWPLFPQWNCPRKMPMNTSKRTKELPMTFPEPSRRVNLGSIGSEVEGNGKNRKPQFTLGTSRCAISFPRQQVWPLWLLSVVHRFVIRFLFTTTMQNKTRRYTTVFYSSEIEARLIKAYVKYPYGSFSRWKMENWLTTEQQSILQRQKGSKLHFLILKTNDKNNFITG